MKILVTGSNGFVGKETCELLKTTTDHQVITYDLMDGYDICDYPRLRDFIQDNAPDRIIHLAAIARFEEADANPKLAFETNVDGTRNIAKVAGEFHIPLIYISTGSVYMPIKQDPPITEEFMACGNSVYACTKYMGELMVKEYAKPYIILRYAHIYGKEKRMHGLIGGFMKRIERGMAPTLYGGKQSNDFTYIKDIARANVLAVEAPWDKWNNVYNIGSGEELTAETAGQIVCDELGWKGTMAVEDTRNVDPQRFIFDIKKAKLMLGYNPQWSFKEGLKDMMEELKHGQK